MFSIAVLRGLAATALAATLLGGTVAASAAEFSPELQSVIAGAKQIPAPSELRISAASTVPSAIATPIVSIASAQIVNPIT